MIELPQLSQLELQCNFFDVIFNLHVNQFELKMCKIAIRFGPFSSLLQVELYKPVSAMFLHTLIRYLTYFFRDYLPSLTCVVV